MKFTKLSSAKMIALLICQTLVPQTFRRLRYNILLLNNIYKLPPATDSNAAVHEDEEEGEDYRLD